MIDVNRTPNDAIEPLGGYGKQHRKYFLNVKDLMVIGAWKGFSEFGKGLDPIFYFIVYRIIYILDNGIYRFGGFAQWYDNLSQDGPCRIGRGSIVFGNAKVTNYGYIKGPIILGGESLVTVRDPELIIPIESSIQFLIDYQNTIDGIVRSRNKQPYYYSSRDCNKRKLMMPQEEFNKIISLGGIKPQQSMDCLDLEDCSIMKMELLTLI